MTHLLSRVETYSHWSRIDLNISKYIINGYIHALPNKIKDRDVALTYRLKNLRINNEPIGVLFHDSPLLGGHIDTAITASHCPNVEWIKSTLNKACATVASPPSQPSSRNDS